LVASNRELLVLSCLLAGLAAWSWLDPFDGLTWWLESLPVFIGLPILWLSRRFFPLTRLVYYVLFAHAALLLVGTHYTYARVPLDFWMQGRQIMRRVING